MKTAKLGTVSEGTLRTVDLISEFTGALDTLVDDTDETKLIADAKAWLRVADMRMELCDDPIFEELGGQIIDDIQDALQSAAPDYCYFGTLEGDGAHFGFWLLPDWQQQARDDGVQFVDDTSKAKPGMVCHVNESRQCDAVLCGQRRQQPGDLGGSLGHSIQPP